jgi:hypothetical protein
MRKRDTRARVERSLVLSLSKLVMPALWLGAALSTACTPHAPERPPCSNVYDFQGGANSRCALSRSGPGYPVYPDYPVYPIGYPSDEDDGPPAPLPWSEIFTSRPETAAREIKAAIEACDRAKLWNAILGYEEFSSFAKTPPDQTTYAQMIEECLATHLQEICDGSPMETHPRLGDPKIQKVVAVPAGGEWKRPFTLVTIALFEQGQIPPKPRPPVMLIDFRGDWWILPRGPGR